MWYKAVWGSVSCFLICVSQVSKILLQPFLKFLFFLYVTTSGVICSVVLLRLLLFDGRGHLSLLDIFFLLSLSFSSSLPHFHFHTNSQGILKGKADKGGLREVLAKPCRQLWCSLPWLAGERPVFQRVPSKQFQRRPPRSCPDTSRVGSGIFLGCFGLSHAEQGMHSCPVWL